MPVTNKSSRQRVVRVPLDYDAYIVKKAFSNPENIHNCVATEINALIKDDFKKAIRKLKKK